MNLSQLYYFRRLAQNEHYTKTAKELFISQPSLSASIAAMEEELHIKLFQKQGRNVKLTRDGREFYRHVCRALDALQDGIDSAHEMGAGLGGSMEIAALPSLMLRFVPELLLRYKQDSHTQTEFHMHTTLSLDDIRTNLRNGTYDFAFSTAPLQDSEFASVPVCPLELVALVAPNHPLSRRKRLTLKDLQNQQLITYNDRSEAGKPIRALLDSLDVDARGAFSDELSIGSYLSQNDKLVALAAKTGVYASGDALVQLPLTGVPEDLSAIYLLYSKKNHQTKPMERFLEFVTTEVQE